MQEPIWWLGGLVVAITLGPWGFFQLRRSEDRIDKRKVRVGVASEDYRILVEQLGGTRVEILAPGQKVDFIVEVDGASLVQKAQIIRDALIRVDPHHRVYFETKYQLFIQNF